MQSVKSLIQATRPSLLALWQRLRGHTHKPAHLIADCCCRLDLSCLPIGCRINTHNMLCRMTPDHADCLLM